MNPANLLTAWARLVVSTLAHAGITDVVASPGSRSTPLMVALCGEPALRVHVLIDERSAGFFAVGQARASGKPSLCVCTSGSAVANYFPAVIEAAEAGIPLLILSADRPFELLDASAPQTIDQTKLFGGYVRAFFDLGMPDAHPDALSAVQRRTAQAVLRATWPEPGAVHLNLRARKPLEPTAADGAEGQALEQRVTALIERGPVRIAAPVFELSEPAVERLAERLNASERTLVACGPTAMTMTAALAGAIGSLCQRAGALLFPETASQVRHALPPEFPRDLVADGLDALLDTRAARTLLEPTLIVEFGRPLVSGAWERFVAAHPDVERWRIASAPNSDPSSSAREILVGDPATAADALARALARHAPTDALRSARGAWVERVARANRVVWECVELACADEPTLVEAQVTRAVLSRLGSGEILALGNSLPIRDADWFSPASTRGLRVWTQRGTNGIDGVLSGAAGAATLSGAPTTLLIGDIGFLHDVGGLWAARQLTTPFVIAVVHNEGGRIFEQLPLAARGDIPAQWLERWTTPHALDLAHAARLYGIAHETAETLDGVGAALDRARSRAGATLVVARVDPSSARRTRRRIAEMLEQRLPDVAER